MRFAFWLFVVLMVGLLPNLGFSQDWTPGHHGSIASKGAPERTFEVYVPKQYEQEKDKLGLPVLFMFHAGGNAKTKDYETWAEKRGVLLVAIHSSRNGPSANNIEAQNACLATLEGSLKMHPKFRFAAGHSGAAQSGWLMAINHPHMFSGLLMCGQCGHPTLPPKYVSVAYIHGEKEPNNPYITPKIAQLKQQGNRVKDLVIPGGHVQGSVEERTGMLDWMLNISFYEREDLTKEEKALPMSLLKGQLQSLKEANDPKQTLEALTSLKDIKAIQKSDSGELLAELWGQAAWTHGQSMSNVRQKHRLLTALSEYKPCKKAPYAKELKNLLKEMRKDKVIKAEYNGHKAWSKIKNTSAANVSRKEKDKIIKACKDIIKRYKGTLAAEDAEKLLKALAAS